MGLKALRLVLSLASLVWASTVAAAPIVTHKLARDDSSEIVYHLDRVDPGQRKPLLLMLQGSGCEPVIERPWLQSEPQLLAPGHVLLVIEKYGILPGEEQPLEDGCSADYWRGNTLRQRVIDATLVIGRLRGESWWNGDLILYGGSEGGAVAAMLAPLLPETKAVVIQSAGIGVSVGDLIRSAVPPAVAAEMATVFEEARANPTGTLRFGGASYLWWADALDVVPAISLLETRAPILLIHGARDSLAPVAAARAARDLFQRAGRANLIYREYADYDHSMRDSLGVDHQEEVLAVARTWLEGLANPDGE